MSTSPVEPYRDEAGLTLADYWRPSIAVDTAVLTVEADRLVVLLTTSKPPERLPGTFLHEGETLAMAVQRSLREKVGLPDLAPQQLEVFDELDRDPRGRVLSAAHVAVVPIALLPPSDRYRLVPVDKAASLPYGHNKIVVAARDRLRLRYRERADPDSLLPTEFTFRELHAVHLAIDPAGTKKMDAFRETIRKQLIPTGRSTSGGVGKPAQLYRKAR